MPYLYPTPTIVAGGTEQRVRQYTNGRLTAYQENIQHPAVISRPRSVVGDLILYGAVFYLLVRPTAVAQLRNALIPSSAPLAQTAVGRALQPGQGGS